MVKLDVTCMRHLTKHDIRVLTAVEVSRAAAVLAVPWWDVLLAVEPGSIQ